MRVLVSNDDGVDAPGIDFLARRLSVVGEVIVVAPDRDRSGASNSLTLDQPIRVTRLENGRYRVAGTPTDCVHLALAGLLDKEPDIVVSGINNSANLGDDVIYSGTVSAAMEGRFLGLPAIAVSLAAKDHKGRSLRQRGAGRAGDHAAAARRSAAGDTILNVNVPDLPWAELRGFAVTRLGRRHRSARASRRPIRGRPIWIGPPGEPKTMARAPFHACHSRGYISIRRFRSADPLSGARQEAGWVSSLSLELGAVA
jgi:5'-nucleotidase